MKRVLPHLHYNTYNLKVHIFVSFVKRRWMKYDCTLKDHAENLTQVKVKVNAITWMEKVMLHISRFVSLSWTHLKCFHYSSLSLSKVIAEKLPVTFNDLKLHWSHKEGSLVASYRFMVPILLVTRCLRVFRIVCIQNRRLIDLYLIERSQNVP